MNTTNNKKISASALLLSTERATTATGKTFRPVKQLTPHSFADFKVCLADLEKQTEKNRSKVENLFTERASAIRKKSTDLHEINTELCDILAKMATFKTLKFLISNNAATDAETTTEQPKNNYGYDMATELLKTLARDISIVDNQKTNETISKAYDLIQTAKIVIWEILSQPIAINFDSIVYTKVLKNGNEKNYTLFSLTCKTIRKYIEDQKQTKQYKKLHYVIGYTDNGTEITTTKRPKNDITDIEQKTAIEFIKHCNLTATEQYVISMTLQGKTSEDIATAKQVTMRAVQKALKSAKQKILAKHKEIRF